MMNPRPLHFVPILLLFLSFLGNWGSGYEEPIIYQILSMAVYPYSIGLSPVFSLVVIVLLITIFVGLIYAVDRSPISRTACFSGLLLVVIGVGTIVLLCFTALSLTDKPNIPPFTLQTIGIGPMLAFFSQIWLAIIFIKNLIPHTDN